MSRDDGDQASNHALNRLAREIRPEGPIVLVARFGLLAFALDDCGLHVAVLSPQQVGSL